MVDVDVDAAVAPRAIPSGMDSKRILPGSISPTVAIGVNVTSDLSPVMSIDGCEVLKPLSLSPASATAGGAVPSTSGTVCNKLANCISRSGQNAASEQCNACAVAERPAPSLLATLTR